MHYQAKITPAGHPDPGPHPGLDIGGDYAHHRGIWGHLADLLEDCNPPIPAFIIGYGGSVQFATRRQDVAGLRFTHPIEPGTGPAAVGTEPEKV